MKIRPITRLIFFSWFTIVIGFSRSENIALCTETHGVVQRKGNVRNGIVRKGDPIYHGDKLITGEDGFVSFMNIYEKTIVKVYENSVVKVLSDRKSRFSRSELALFGGKVIVEMDEQNDREFVLRSPSAIATASGTHFLTEYRDELLYNNLSYCIFTVLTGKMEVENIKSGHSIYMDQGETVISTRKGKFLLLDTFRDNSGIANTLMEAN